MTTSIPAPITVQHKKFVPLDPPQKDGHGNPKGAYATPVPRKVQAINEQNRSTQVVDVALLNRSATALEMAVTDPSVYKQGDVVLIDGFAFHVTGVPSDDRRGPFPLLNRLLGGSVRIERIT